MDDIRKSIQRQIRIDAHKQIILKVAFPAWLQKQNQSTFPALYPGIRLSTHNGSHFPNVIFPSWHNRTSLLPLLPGNVMLSNAAGRSWRRAGKDYRGRQNNLFFFFFSSERKQMTETPFPCIRKSWWYNNRPPKIAPFRSAFFHKESRQCK